MARVNKYVTKQKDTIISTIMNQKYEFTVKDIYKQIKEYAGLTTIYRVIIRLANEGRLKKYIGKNNITYYQYLEECDAPNHFYLKCSCCGSIFHIDCKCIENLSKHIFKEHQFKLAKEQVFIDGMCDKCLKNS